MTGPLRITGLTLLTCAALSACVEYRDLAGETHERDPEYCTFCHGSVLEGVVLPAPPADTLGNASRMQRGVGAHAIHVTGGEIGGPVLCDNCHRIPEQAADAGHMDDSLPAEVYFTGLAVLQGLVATAGAPDKDEGGATGPGYNEFAQVRCLNVYCHGATLSGGKATDPSWNGPDSELNPFSSCDSCHGFPPPAPHAASTQCSDCHGEVAAVDGTIADPTRHVDGVLDVSAIEDCSACHGSDASPAPPKDLAGNTDPEAIGVGAHQSHLGALHGISTAIACEQCHVVPATVSDDGHVDGDDQAELSFGSLAALGGLTPAYDAGTGTCSSVYCHGADRPGAMEPEPVWNDTDGSPVECGACHGFPPAPPHPATDECGACHDTADGSGGIAKPEQHVDGQLQISGGGCNTCHGNAANAAPPLDLDGLSETTEKTVGAHQEHLMAASGISAAVDCEQCHEVPAVVSAAGHLDGDGTAEVTFGPLARTDGLLPAPEWDAGTETCDNTYCHGATLTGGTNKTPQWTKVDGSQDACGTCHGFPPPAPHSGSTACDGCHAETVSGGQIAHPDKHIDGTVQVTVGTECNACHGSELNDAPPTDLSGSSDTALTTVGAHQEHLTAASAIAGPIPCDECHTVPGAVGDAGHMDGDGTAEVQFGPLASTGGSQGQWTPGTEACSNVYCHGATLSGGTNQMPHWTMVDGSQDACGSCHGVSPPTGRHPSVLNDHAFMGTNCTFCHKGVTNSAGNAIDSADLHVDGTITVVLDSGTWDGVTKTCNPACHDDESWEEDDD